MLVLALVYRCVYSMIGGYVVARLAPSKPMKHVIILIILGTIVGTLGAVANWDKSVGQEWYPVLLVLLSIPAVWFGGKLKKV
jgi:F0F1-type ATP synthase assembly protein I